MHVPQEETSLHFEKYGVKTSEKANCILALGLLRPDPLALGAQEVTKRMACIDSN